MIRLFILVLMLICNFSSTSSGAENLTSEKTNTSRKTPTTGTNTVKNISTDLPSVVNKTVSSVGGPLYPNHTENQEKKETKSPDESWWYKLRTDPVATFTFLLFIATGLLWWSTRQLVLGAENTAAQELRSYMFTRFEGIPIKLGISGSLSVTTIIKNFGKTPAHDVVTCHRIGIYELPLTITNKLEDLNFPPESSKAPVAPGEEGYHIIGFDGLTADRISIITSGKVALFVFGEIKYIDVFKKTHSTKYCFISTGADFTDGSLAHYHEGNEAY